MGNCVLISCHGRQKAVKFQLTGNRVDYYTFNLNITSQYPKYSSLSMKDIAVVINTADIRDISSSLSYSYNSSTGVITISAVHSAFDSGTWVFTVVILKGINNV